MRNLVHDIGQFIPAERIKSKLIDRLSYASDAGFYQLVPAVVVLPHSVEEVKKLLAIASEYKVPVVFRAGGTSLSGQSITDGILVDLSQHWRGIKVSEGAVTVQPGITGGMVNHYLKKYAQKIGPDPASIHAAMMGGIISNNASGMCCGVANNSYHTVQHLHFVLADGHDYDTSKPGDYQRFENEQKQLVEVLLNSRQELLQNEKLFQRIRKKYQTKNTVGYSLNALLDYEYPLDIFAHLLVGAEGTLGFIAQATMLTLPDKPFKAAAMLYFRSIREACSSIATLKATGVEALELMDWASLQSVKHLQGLPEYFHTLPDGTAALLCEYQTTTIDELQQKVNEAQLLLNQFSLLHDAVFETEEKKRMFYWKLRKGMFPSVGAVRKRGTTVILEDVAVPVEQLADAVADLQQLFGKYGYHEAIIFGHAKDGNIHFVITQLLDTPAEIDRYDRFLKEVVDIIVGKYDGALKAEHGTGRNMAPFVEAEWGGDAYRIMKHIKQVTDPLGLLNPGVIINEDVNAHIKNLKDLPQVEEEVDKCIECGFCEPSCPSRDLTMTPRRRIVARRSLKRLQAAGDDMQANELLRQYQFDGLDTCATDGLCATDCPVNINTGELVKRLRKEKHGRFQNKIAGMLANQYGLLETAARLGIRLLASLNNIGGFHVVQKISGMLHRILPGVPRWMNHVKGVGNWKGRHAHFPDAVYFTSCINRIMQASDVPLQLSMHELADKAGVKLHSPDNLAGKCCGQPFSSKGYFEAGKKLEARLIDAMLEWTDNGRIPVVCDFTSCTYTMFNNVKHLPEAYQHKMKQLKLMDSIDFIEQYLLPKLKVNNKADKVAIHPTCAAIKLNLAEPLEKIARAAAGEVIKPAYAGCCGMAGDRGFQVPALTTAATKLELQELQGQSLHGCYSSASTCQIALSENSGLPYEHIAVLLNEVAVKAE